MKYFVFLFLFCFSSLHAGRVEYVDYLKMDQEGREKLEKKYVKEKNGLFSLKIQSYEVISDVSAAKTLEIAVMMDDFYRQFTSKFSGAFKKRKAPTVYVMANKETYRKAVMDFCNIKPPDWSAGLYISYKTGALFGNMEFGDQAISIMKHEGTHQLLDAYIEKNIPTWFNEGTATVFETFKMEQSMLTNVQKNLIESNYPMLLEKEGDSFRIPVKDLVKIDGEAWSKSKDPNRQYASAWCLVHYLLTTEDGLKIYNKILNTLRANQDVERVLSSRVIESLESAMVSYFPIIKAHAQWGRRLEQWHAQENFRALEAETAKYLEAYPNSQEAQFYGIFTVLLTHPEQCPADAVDQLEKLEKADYGHPEMDFAKALAYGVQGNSSKESYYMRRQLANMPLHREALAWQEKNK